MDEHQPNGDALAQDQPDVVRTNRTILPSKPSLKRSASRGTHDRPSAIGAAARRARRAQPATPAPGPTSAIRSARRLLDGLVDERGWQRPLAEARVFADWASLVGADIAAHCQPVNLNDGELRIAAESTAWATQLQLMAGALLASLVRELGPDVVRKIFITGPTGPSWKHGGWSVRGARGPRDTYG